MQELKIKAIFCDIEIFKNQNEKFKTLYLKTFPIKIRIVHYKESQLP